MKENDDCEVPEESGIENPPKDLNSLQRIIGVFCYPGKTFEQLDRKPDWLLPLVILTAGAIFFAFLIAPVTWPAQRAIQKQAMADQGMSYDQIEKALAVTERIGKIVGPIGAAVGPGIGSLVGSLILWFVGNVLLGGKTTYGKVFALHVYASLIGLLDMLIRLPLILLKKSVLIEFNLALFLPDEQAKTLIYRVAQSLGIFGVWHFVVLAIGFSIIYRFSTKKSACAMAVLFLLSVAFSTGMRTLSGQ